MNNHLHIDDLIAKQLTGEATEAELMQLHEWMQLSEENRRYADSMIRLHDAAGSVPDVHVDTDRAYRKVMQRIQASEQGSGYGKKPTAFLGMMMRVAAMLAIAAGLGYAAFRLLSQDAVTTERFAVLDETRETKLADSTTVFLNRNTTLVSTFSDKSRKVELEGEAFFELASDPDRPFEVHAGGLVIHDIGTAFNVKAPSGNDTIRVLVTDGEVIVVSGSNKSVTLRKGDEASYLRSRDEFILSAIADTNALSYKTRVFVFDNATLGNLISKVSDVYGISIQLEGNISSCRITATFRDEEPANLLGVVAETLNLQLTKADKGFVLSGSGCDE